MQRLFNDPRFELRFKRRHLCTCRTDRDAASPTADRTDLVDRTDLSVEKCVYIMLYTILHIIM